MIELSNVNINFDKPIFINESIKIYPNKVNLITGNSGCGKSSLLYKIGLISDISNINYNINTININSFNEINNLRKYNIGFVLQDQCLFEQYDVIGNLKLYSSFAGIDYNENKFKEILNIVALKIPLKQKIDNLSGGEKQRLQIACALCKNPDILILDEPTFALDEENEKLIFSLLFKYAHNKGKCVIIASHSYFAHDYADVIYHIENGKIVSEKMGNSNDILILKNNKSKYDMKFYLKYIKYFLIKFKQINILMMILLIFLSISVLVINHSINKQMNKSITQLNQASENQLLVTGNKYNLYLNELENSIDKNKLNQLLYMYDLDMYPFNPINGIMNGINIKIIPIFNQNDLSKNMSNIFGNSQDGIILSNHLYSKLSLETYDWDQLNLSIEGNKELERIVINQEFKVNGVLKKGVYSSFQPNCEDYIMINYNILNTFFDFYSSKDVLSYVIFTNTFDEYKIVIDILKESNFGVNTDFTQINALETIIEYAKIIKVFLYICVFSIFYVLLLTLQINYFYKRKREFSLLYINGLSSQDIKKMILIEMILKILASIIILLINGLLFYILHIDYFNKIGLESFGILLLFHVTIIFTIYLLTTKYLKKFYPDLILRQ